ncbi:glycosyl hydrolase 115 family protein [Catenovulum adriaticum]|uniref:Glycosyl hydrolase 115 family protein n=1 Tax=Catenovulum adriaticum TaxID=2984846 RepID=A0ABY7AQS9_9ALTE|nr:glycosyl hydrolase 115 family protein [Catenovulum sp. TS8]WAJ71902.1 glycosyl hydrolase 115 family protein [Catenovulum sp. TS8]
MLSNLARNIHKVVKVGSAFVLVSSLALTACQSTKQSDNKPVAKAVTKITINNTGREYVTTTDTTGASFPLVSEGVAAKVWVSDQDHPGVLRIANNLQTDISKVTGVTPQRVDSEQLSGSVVIIGTIGQSSIVDKLISQNKIDASQVSGRWDTYALQTVVNPLPNVDKALVIFGSNKRGTMYGMYELSENIGVSPWYWWADVPVKTSDNLFVKPGFHFSKEPVVKYRGIFINDDWALMRWAQEKFGGYNAKMYAHVYDLMLRLRANYLWPGMLGKSIYRDDPESARLANELGIVLGTSHHEPMTRAHSDWSRGKKNYGNAEWDYSSNEEGLKKFWREGIERNKDYEVLITMGMRGDGDTGMEGNVEDNMAIMEKIVADQRQIIAEVKGQPAEEVPQVWALYKEVQNYYEQGMKVPDDVILLWCDDNWGNLRRIPTAEERKRPGGAGIYYHFDYHGAPRSYEWINTNPLPKIWEQMNLAYEYNANKIWVANVGDIKPMEVPTEFFLKMAWDPKAMSKDKLNQFLVEWAEREFGQTYAAQIADIVAKYAKYNAWRKPELLSPNTFSLVNYKEAERVQQGWKAITEQAEAIYKTLPEQYRDAFYQLVLYPTKASGNLTDMYITAGRNYLYANQGRASTNNLAETVQQQFALNESMINEYHTIANGKWNQMMSYPFVGYKSWNAPKKNTMPELVTIKLPNDEVMGVSVEGTEFAWPEMLEKNTITFELENFANQTKFPPFTVIEDSSASGGKAVVWPENSAELAMTTPLDNQDGQFQFHFELSKAAKVKFQLRVSAANTHDDSLFFKLDSGKWLVKNNLKASSGYLTLDMTTFNRVSAGKHTISIMRREDGLKLDRAYLTAYAGEITSEQAQPGAVAELPTYDAINQQTYWIDVFKRGSSEIKYDISATEPWVKLSKPTTNESGDKRYWVNIDWDKAPIGSHTAKVIVKQKGGQTVSVLVNTVRSKKYTKEAVKAHGGLTGPIVFAAESYSNHVANNGVSWQKIPDYGRGVSGMSVFPALSESVTPGKNAPFMEYDVLITQAGTYTVDVVTGIALNVQPDRGVSFAVSFDQQAPVIVDAFAGQEYKDPNARKDKSSPAILSWYEWVRNNARTMSSEHKIDKPGIHKLKVWMIDPGVVIEKIIIHQGDVQTSYLGPVVKQ